MKVRLSEAIRVYTRYDIEDENGDTRRKRNERVGETSPRFEIPNGGKYIWDWFIEIDSCISRIRDGVCYLIPPSEYLSWAQLTGNLVYSWEYGILMDMDKAFCSETNLELHSEREKAEHARQSELENTRRR